MSARDSTRGRSAAAGPQADAANAAPTTGARQSVEARTRGHRLAEMRKAAGLTQAQVAHILGVSQSRVSKVEHGEISRLDIVRSYVAALGGTLDVVATLGDRRWTVA